VTRIDDPWSDSPDLEGGYSDRSSRIALRREQARERRRFLMFSAVGTLIPGTGLIAAGRRTAGWLILLFLWLGALAVAIYIAIGGRSRWIELGLDASFLQALGFGLIALAAVYLLVALVSHRLLEPEGTGNGTRLLSALLVVFCASLVITPMLLGSRYAFSQRDLVNIFPAGGDSGVSLTKPTEATKRNPWAGKPRVNVLILGSDAGADREGVRPDSIILASIDTEGGDTTLFSLPRNLQRVPFPDLPGTAGELHDAYPRGFTAPGDAGESLINAVYRNAPAAHPEIFEALEESGADPGAEATKLAVMGALGVDVDYYIMVNLEGFERIVDALGGIDINVPYRIPIGTKTNANGTCTRPQGYIEKGQNRHLNGYQALWFARTRCGPGIPSDDYERVRRQRCVIQSIAEAADPLTLITKYSQITSAAADLIQTDIPQQLLPAFAELGLLVQGKPMRSIAFTDEVITPANPDYDEMHELVAAALAPAPTATPSTSAPAGSVAQSPSASASAPAVAPSPTRSSTKISSDTGAAEDLSTLCG